MSKIVLKLEKHKNFSRHISGEIKERVKGITFSVGALLAFFNGISPSASTLEHVFLKIVRDVHELP